MYNTMYIILYNFLASFSSEVIKFQQRSNKMQINRTQLTHYGSHFVWLQIFKVVGVWYLSWRPFTLHNRQSMHNIYMYQSE